MFFSPLALMLVPSVMADITLCTFAPTIVPTVDLLQKSLAQMWGLRIPTETNEADE